VWVYTPVWVTVSLVSLLVGQEKTRPVVDANSLLCFWHCCWLGKEHPAYKQEAQLPQKDNVTRCVTIVNLCWLARDMRARKVSNSKLCAIRYATYDFLLVFHCNYVSIWSVCVFVCVCVFICLCVTLGIQCAVSLSIAGRSAPHWPHSPHTTQTHMPHWLRYTGRIHAEQACKHRHSNGPPKERPLLPLP